MQNNYKKFIEDLYNGMIAFFPDDMFGQKGGQGYKVERSFQDSNGRNWNKEDFIVYVLNWTGSHSTDEAAAKIKNWKKVIDANQEPTSDMPPQEILEEAEKIEEATPQTEVKKEVEKRELLKLSQKYAEEKIVPETPEVKEGLIKISPETFQDLVSRGAQTPFQVVTFFAPPKKLAGSPQTAAAISQAVSLNQLEKKMGGLTKQQKELITLLRQAEFSFYAQSKLERTSVPVDQITVLMGHGLPQGQLALLIHSSDSGPSMAGELAKGIARQVAQKAISKVATKLITSALTKAGVSIATSAAAGTGGAAAGAATGAAVGGPLAPITALIGLIIGWIATKIPDAISWFKRNFGKVLMGAGAFLFGTGFILQSSPLMIGGLATGLGGGILQAGGITPALAGVGSIAGSVFTGLASMTIASFATPIIVSLFAVPAIVAIILFIINSGAYIVPPLARMFGGNPYIDVEKKPSPEGPFQNSQLNGGIKVDYTITIKAKRSTLTNISFEYECEVIRKNSAPPCPGIIMKNDKGETVTPGAQPNLIINSGESYVITYQAVYNSPSFSDSAVIDTFKVTADVPEETGTQAEGGAAIIIGNPPTGCFKFEGSWPANFKTNETKAITELVGKATVYSAKLCQAGEIILKYGGNNGGVGGDVLHGPNVITFYNAGLQYGHTSTLFTLTHETGHIFARRQGEIFRSYADTPGVGNVLICSYPFNNSTGESFAETIGLYVANVPGHAYMNYFACFGGNFKAKYPNHWKFARDNIFQQNLGW